MLPADYVSSAITGIVVALTSWLPVGPEGGAVSRFLGSVAKGYSNYLVPAYLGVIFAVIFYFRDPIAVGTQRALSRSIGAELKYLFYASLFTLVLGYPLVAGNWEFLDPTTSDAVNAAVGAAMILVGLACLVRKRAPLEEVEKRLADGEEPTLLDAVLSGIAQGLAMLGELSATGLVLLVLSLSGMKPKKALKLLFMISPIYMILRLLLLGSWNPAMPVYLPFTAFITSFVTAILFMKALMVAGERLSRRTFLTLMGLIPIVVYLMEVML